MILNDQEFLLRFRVSNDTFALPIARVLQIVDRRPVTRVPHLAPSIAGVFNHDGVIIPLVDLATKFRIEHSQSQQRSSILLVYADHSTAAAPIGLLTDAVIDVVPVRAESIEPPPSFGARIRLDYLAGVVKIGETFTLVLDVDRFLTAAELLDLDAARDPVTEEELVFA